MRSGLGFWKFIAGKLGDFILNQFPQLKSGELAGRAMRRLHEACHIDHIPAGRLGIELRNLVGQRKIACLQRAVGRITMHADVIVRYHALKVERHRSDRRACG